MLQRIEPGRAELGMFIERFDGSWLTHPFWRRRFVISDPKQLATLRASAVEAVIIDTSRGIAPTPEATPARRRNPSALASGHAAAPRDVRIAARPQHAGHVARPAARQFGNAKRVLRNSTKTVSQVFLKARLGQAVRLSDVEGVIDDIYQSISESPQALTALLRCQRDAGDIYRHALSVSALMVALGRAMRLAPERTKQAGLVGLIMDIGVSQLHARLPEVDDDYRKLPQACLDEHVYFGHDLAASMDDIPSECLRACLDHHERVDGSGYPAGLQREEIGEFARMAAICDEFDYLVARGFAGQPLDPHLAIQEMLRRWHEFDTDILRVFQRATGLYPIGTFVELRSGRIGMVVDINPDEPDAPVVQTFSSWHASPRGRHATVDLSRCYGSDGITRVAKPSGLTGVEVQTHRARLLEAAHRS